MQLYPYGYYFSKVNVLLARFARSLPLPVLTRLFTFRGFDVSMVVLDF